MTERFNQGRRCSQLSKKKVSCARVKVGVTEEKFGRLVTGVVGVRRRDRTGMGVVAFDHQWGHRSTQLPPASPCLVLRQWTPCAGPGPRLGGMSSVPMGLETPCCLDSAV